MQQRKDAAHWWEKNRDPSLVDDLGLPPERRLLIAVFNRALEDLEPVDRISVSDRREAVNWFLNPFAQARFPFAYVALSLEIPRSYITILQQKIKKAQEYNLGQLRKRERERIERRERKRCLSSELIQAMPTDVLPISTITIK